MILIADSGSTSTDWVLLSPTLNTVVCKVNTQGLNPFHKSHDEILEILNRDLKSQLILHTSIEEIEKIYFYGSGCSQEGEKNVLRKVLKTISQNASIFVDHDTMASAIACCGDDMGIACILGTGSNSCVYDGKSIVKTLPSLGYMLGDEGSGTHLGKGLLRLFLKNKLSNDLLDAFNQRYALSSSDVLEHLYRKEKPGSFIASFAPFVMDYKENKNMKIIINQSFNEFFDEFILPYPESETYPINFVGSIAFLLSKELKEVGSKRGFNVHRIVRYPIDSLAEYHLYK